MTEDTKRAQANILVVDDEETLRGAVVKYLTRVGYQVEGVGSAEDALEKIKESEVHLAVFDVNMPGMSGVDLLPEALAADPNLAVLMLSGVKDAATAARALQRGAFDYLTKPIDMRTLEESVESALRRRDTLMQQEELSSWVKEELAARTQELERQHRKLERITVATLEALINALEAKDPYLVGHSVRVASLAATVAHELEMTDDEIEAIRTAGRLHDIGQIGIRESVLHKEGALTEDEQRHIREHVVIGANILSPMEHLGPISEWVRYHHEHWNGSGYPDGLEGEAIPIQSRIIGAAEVYDALTSPRPYQPTSDSEKAIGRLKQLAGTVLDPNVVDALDNAVSQRQFLTFVSDGEQSAAHASPEIDLSEEDSGPSPDGPQSAAT